MTHALTTAESGINAKTTGKMFFMGGTPDWMVAG
jgi:hypothetical protein